MYGGILSLTYSYLFHYWHLPTMVGFCHGGNLLGNHDHDAQDANYHHYQGANDHDDHDDHDSNDQE